MKIIQKPKRHQAKKVEDLHAQPFLTEAREMVKMIISDKCFFPASKNTVCLSVAQPQVNEDNPLRYFVLNPKWEELARTFNGVIIANPKLLQGDWQTTKTQLEACVSFPYRPMVKVQRFLSIEVRYDIITSMKRGDDGNYHAEVKEGKVAGLEGVPAVVFQHSLDCLNGKYIY